MSAPQRSAAAEAAAELAVANEAAAAADIADGQLWLEHMLAGTWERAWAASDRIHARGLPDPHRYWQGESLAGRRVMLRSLHGLGDAVQMFQYLPQLRAACAELTVEVQPALLELAPYFHGMGRVITWEPAAGAVQTASNVQPAFAAQPAFDLQPDFDVQLEVNELPWLFRTQLADLPVGREYLRLPAELLGQTAAAMNVKQRPAVGVVWACGSWNPARDVPLDLIKDLATDRGFDWWNLQDSARSHEADNTRMLKAGLLVGDGLLALATTIANLDLVITPDTLAAHLAGALGTPAWILLQHTADWRWMTGRTDSPWYPRARLFRQPTPGDWRGAVAAVRAALPAWHAERRNARETRRAAL